MRIGLIGYGKMGREIEAIALGRGHTIEFKIDKDNAHELNAGNLQRIEVAIEFTTPHTAFANVSACMAAGVPVVTGTTGWLDQLKLLEDMARAGKGTLFYASNYSIGVNLFFKVNQQLAQYLNGIEGYNVSIKEIHHTQKLDAPSGTAITLANIIGSAIGTQSGWTLLPHTEKGKIPIEALREGSVPGTHVVTFDSEQDQIVLSHIAKSRKGFALGAVLAAEFIVGKTGFYGMDDLLKL